VGLKKPYLSEKDMDYLDKTLNILHRQGLELWPNPLPGPGDWGRSASDRCPPGP
jgi:hypothetical protein